VWLTATLLTKNCFQAPASFTYPSLTVFQTPPSFTNTEAVFQAPPSLILIGMF
jgi:hypothetical protein